VEEVKECKAQRYLRPKKGNIRVGVKVLIESTDEDVRVSPFSAKVADAEGYAYNNTSLGCKPALKSVTLSSGEKARGWLSFEVPKDASSLKMTYAPYLTGGKQTLKFDLGR